MGSYRKCVMTGFICRLCSEHKNVVIHIYSQRAKEMCLMDKITMLPISIKRYDKLPKTICENCIEHLCQQFDLIQTIKRNVELRLQHNIGHTLNGCPTECPFFYASPTGPTDPIPGTSSDPPGSRSASPNHSVRSTSPQCSENPHDSPPSGCSSSQLIQSWHNLGEAILNESTANTGNDYPQNLPSQRSVSPEEARTLSYSGDVNVETSQDQGNDNRDSPASPTPSNSSSGYIPTVQTRGDSASPTPSNNVFVPALQVAGNSASTDYAPTPSNACGFNPDAQSRNAEAEEECPYYLANAERVEMEGQGEEECPALDNVQTGHLSDSSLSVNRRSRNPSGRFSW